VSILAPVSRNRKQKPQQCWFLELLKTKILSKGHPMVGPPPPKKKRKKKEKKNAYLFLPSFIFKKNAI